ncbi:MAG: 5-oxoprolinase subunit PxpB [Pseudomonadota bacterium]
MATRININADMAEGWGAYGIGDDETLLGIVKSANIACGMHGGDAAVMHRVILAAEKAGVSIGAHPGFNDLWGFGRRQIRMKADELEYLVAYQIGAMLGMAAYSGIAVTHVKAHGALNNMACKDADYAAAIMRAQKTVAPDLIALVMPGTEMEKAAHAQGFAAAEGAARHWHLPACYEGEYAPDLEDVAERAGMTPAAVVDLHAGIAHHVYMIGFLPGAPYMGDLPASIDFPRRSDPRTKVPAGSVAIAVGLTVIYPVTSPGGWHLIGRTPVTLFDKAAGGEAPALLRPGDAVSFVPTPPDRYAEISRAAAAGDWQPQSTAREHL